MARKRDPGVNKKYLSPWLPVLVFLLLAPYLWADSLKIYVRNREVQGRRFGSDVYLSREQLSQWFLPGELNEVQWLDNGQIRIGEESLSATGGVSLNWLAPRLGFERRHSQGIVDWVKVQASVLEPGARLNPEQSLRRPEYREAGRRMQMILQQLPTVQDAAIQARVRKIGLEVAAASPLRDITWNFFVVHMAAPNAACTGEGHVFVTDSLLKLGINDDELAGVMGHEIAHGVRRHVFRRADLLKEIRRLLEDFGRLQARIDAGENSLKLRAEAESYSRRRDNLQYQYDHERFYNRVDEEEADVLGLRYAVTAGYSAEGLGQCLQKLENYRVQNFGTAVLDDDMSHPPTKRRLENLIRARRNAGF